MTRLNYWSHLMSVAAIGCAAATLGSVAHAQTSNLAPSETLNERACSNASLQGAYAFAIEGVFVDAPTPLPLRGVAVTQFDGRGHVTQVDHVVFNGTPPPLDWTPATGWYELKADCTGRMELEIPGSPFSPVILRLSVGANGTHINAVVSKPGYVVSSTGTKVEQKGNNR